MTNYDLDIHYEEGVFTHEFFDGEGNLKTEEVDKETASLHFETFAYDAALQLRFLEDTRKAKCVEFAKEDYALFSKEEIDLKPYSAFASLAHGALFQNNEFTFDGTLDAFTYSKKRWVLQGFILYSLKNMRKEEYTKAKGKILELLARVQGSEMEEVYRKVLKGEQVKI